MTTSHANKDKVDQDKGKLRCRKHRIIFISICHDFNAMFIFRRFYMIST